MKSYPYIGKFVGAFGDFSVAVFCSNNLGALLENNIDSNQLYKFEGDFNDKRFKNITAEYLANTYGDVKSKDHAEFIVKLAEVNKIQAVNPWREGLLFCFYYNSDGDLILAFYPEKSAKSDGEKQITIPLPPECESVNEWPKVGSKVTWGTKAVNGEVKAIDNDNDFAWVKNDYGNYVTVCVGHLEKPKTPEQELREFLHLLWRENNEDFDDFADIAILHLKKKGEGDE